MPKLLASKSRGLTLIELMVAMSIIAIVTVAGVSVYTGAQKNARDSKRRADLESIAKALDLRFQTTTGTCPGSGVAAVPGSYCPLQPSFFALSEVPVDPNGTSQPYCLYSSTSATAVINNPSAVWNTTTCPDLSPMTSITKTAIAKTTNNVPVSGTVLWKICASLESGAVFCRASQQQ